MLLSIPQSTLHNVCMFSEQLIDIQENVDALPDEIVTEVKEITGTDIAKVDKVQSDIQEVLEHISMQGEKMVK